MRISLEEQTENIWSDLTSSSRCKIFPGLTFLIYDSEYDWLNENTKSIIKQTVKQIIDNGEVTTIKR